MNVLYWIVGIWAVMELGAHIVKADNIGKPRPPKTGGDVAAAIVFLALVAALLLRAATR